MSLFDKLTEKPWLTPGPHPWAAADGRGDDLNATATVALKLYFGVATVMFALVFIGYLMRGNHPGLEHEMPRDWRPLPATWLLWYNSGVLILSSIAWQWARGAAHRGDMVKLQMALLLGGAFAFVFLMGQLAVWLQLDAGGYFMTTNPAVAFFYVVVVLHGLHLLGGLAVWVRTMSRVWERVEPSDLILSVDLCTLYWHFLLIVWLVMFALLLMG